MKSFFVPFIIVVTVCVFIQACAPTDPVVDVQAPYDAELFKNAFGGLSQADAGLASRLQTVEAKMEAAKTQTVEPVTTEALRAEIQELRQRVEILESNSVLKKQINQSEPPLPPPPPEAMVGAGNGQFRVLIFTEHGCNRCTKWFGELEKTLVPYDWCFGPEDSNTVQYLNCSENLDLVEFYGLSGELPISVVISASGKAVAISPGVPSPNVFCEWANKHLAIAKNSR